MTLFHLVYTSVAHTRFQEEDLLNLLTHCRRANREQQVTGALIYSGGYFIQLLEGEEDVVKSLYRRITTDQRHQQVNLLVSESIHERRCPDWAMAGLDAEQLGELGPAQFDRLWQLADDGDPDRVFGILDEFIDLCRQRAAPSLPER